MSRCGICGGGISLTVVPHAQLCEDDIKAPARPYAPEKTINDIWREIQEEEGNE